MAVRKLLWAISAFTALVTVFAVTGVASAHVFKSDGNISVELHIEPDDHPITGTPTTYRLSFKDKTGTFALPKCDCKVTIMQNNVAVTSAALAATSANISEDQYTFTKPGAYTLHVSGVSKTPDLFQPFAVAYDVHVAQNPAAVHKISAAAWAGIGGGITVILAGAYMLNRAMRDKG